MHRANLHAFIDFIAFTCFVFLTSSGIILHFLLPPRSGRTLNIWGLDRHEWGEIHFWIAVVMFVVLVFHLFLHWRWIASVVKGHKPEGSGIRVLLGIIGLTVILILAVAPLVSSPDETARGERGAHQEYPSHRGGPGGGPYRDHGPAD